ncbi:MAG: (2Fe-2S)-binding protein [candidate division WOR-3 bacterium]|nr:MAG: (2Fe-2S)-binding protein [candidate division WOR-3 bacterium]
MINGYEARIVTKGYGHITVNSSFHRFPGFPYLCCTDLTLTDFRVEYSVKIICRCEDITEEEIVQKIKEGYQTMDDLKRIMRVTMGLCQGKGCRKHIAKILSRELNIPIKDIVQPTYRPPVKPIPISATIDKT